MQHTSIDLHGKTVLITGGAGFIGSNLAVQIQRSFPSCEVVVFDCFRSDKSYAASSKKSLGHYKNLLDFTGNVICGDLMNKEDLRRLQDFRFDYIFHHAAISDTRIYDQELIIRSNVNAFTELLKMAVDMKATVVYASSAATYGSMPAPQTVGREAPDNPYAFTKLMMDNIASGYRRKYPEIGIVGLRYFNVYGPREYYKGRSASMVVQLGHQLLAGRPPRLFFGSDCILRDFVYIEDVIQAVLLATAARQSGVYNVGSGTARSFEDIATILQKELGTALPVEYFENPYTGYQTHTEADLGPSSEMLGYKPRFSLEEGIKSYLPEIIRTYHEEVITSH